jgi:NADPH-dependent 2,4-dienoyl-CoA reductase/sulfur reductase-like enzyme
MRDLRADVPSMSANLRGRGGELSEAETVLFEFEGQRLSGRRAESLGAALTAAGIREFRVTRQNEPRGLFCGMGVCQECLVEIDGVSNQRACMTKLERPVSIRRQRSLARASAAAADARDPQPRGIAPLKPDLLVVGGGIGGLNAARSAALAGANVVLVDDRPLSGGQYYKQPLAIEALAQEHASDRQFAGGRALIRSAERAGVTMFRGARVWGAFEPLELLILDNGASRLCRPKRLVVAAGAYERGLPVPGWTLPGVMTTGAAQTLLRSYRVLAGRRVLIAGNGPLNFQVAVELARAGAEIAAVVELAARPSLSGLPALGAMVASTPALALRGAGYLAELSRRGVPLLYGSVLAEVAGNAGVLSALVKRWPLEPQDKGRRFDADAVCMGYGFMPSNEILRALGCTHRFDPARGHLVTERDEDQRSSVPEIYAVGDCAGLSGAPAAEAEGIIAGIAAARSIGLELGATSRAAQARARSALARHRRFQAGLWRLFRAQRPAGELATPETIVCRCEELSHGGIVAEMQSGFASVGALKRRTRGGMGRCQGRYCSPVLAALSAESEGRPLDEAGYWAARPPVIPITIGDIVRQRS